MMFNVEKCKIMHIGRSNMQANYVMNGKSLEKVEQEKDLGVIVTRDLKVSNQCIQACNKASMMLGMIKRSIAYKDPRILVKLYKSLVRPHLEYCTAAWSPYYVKDKNLLESIQHRFTRMIPGFAAKSYDVRLRELGLWSLEERRNRADLIETFRISRGQSAITMEQFFEMDMVHRTRGHTLKCVKQRSKTDLRQHFFSERVLDRWNGLDQKTIDSVSVNSFKSNLQRLRDTRMGLFMDS
jgi:hypothetical protein